MTAISCQIFLGAMFMFAAYGKASSLDQFQDILDKFPISRPYKEKGAILIILFQSILGVCLIIQFQSIITLGITITTLAFMSSLTWYGFKYYDIKRCGCYGNLIHMTPAQSIKLNIIYILIAILGLYSIYHL